MPVINALPHRADFRKDAGAKVCASTASPQTDFIDPPSMRIFDPVT